MTPREKINTKRDILQFPTTETGGRRGVLHPFPPLLFFFGGIGGMGTHGRLQPFSLSDRPRESVWLALPSSRLLPLICGLVVLRWERR